VVADQVRSAAPGDTCTLVQSSFRARFAGDFCNHSKSSYHEVMVIRSSA